MDRTVKIVPAILVSLWILMFVLLSIATWSSIQDGRAQRACQAMGYESATSYPFHALAYCHKTVKGTSVTVLLELAERR